MRGVVGTPSGGAGEGTGNASHGDRKKRGTNAGDVSGDGDDLPAVRIGRDEQREREVATDDDLLDVDNPDRGR